MAVVGPRLDVGAIPAIEESADGIATPAPCGCSVDEVAELRIASGCGVAAGDLGTVVAAIPGIGVLVGSADLSVGRVDDGAGVTAERSWPAADAGAGLTVDAVTWADGARAGGAPMSEPVETDTDGPPGCAPALTVTRGPLLATPTVALVSPARTLAPADTDVPVAPRTSTLAPVDVAVDPTLVVALTVVEARAARTVAPALIALG